MAGEDDAIDSVDVEGLRQVGWELDAPASIRVAGDGDRGDDAHQLGLHRGTEGELLAHERARGAIPHQQAALRGGEPPGDHPGERPQAHQKHEEQQPDAEHLRASERAGDDRPVEQPDHQGREGREAEQGRDLVERALVEQVGVAVVEAERFRGDHERDRDGDHRRSQVLVAEDDGAHDQRQGRGRRCRRPASVRRKIASRRLMICWRPAIASARRRAEGAGASSAPRSGPGGARWIEADSGVIAGAPRIAAFAKVNGLFLPPLLSCPDPRSLAGAIASERQAYATQFSWSATQAATSVQRSGPSGPQRSARSHPGVRPTGARRDSPCNSG